MDVAVAVPLISAFVVIAVLIRVPLEVFSKCVVYICKFSPFLSLYIYLA